jgi:hypothetical protein
VCIYLLMNWAFATISYFIKTPLAISAPFCTYEPGSRLDCMNICCCAGARSIFLREELSHSAQVIIKNVLFIYNILPLVNRSTAIK